MKRRPLWPLLLPLASVSLIAIFISLTRWLGGFGYRCGVLEFSGFYCPGCGGTRCAHALSRGNLLQAWGHNPLLTIGAFTFALICLYLIIRITLLGKTAPPIPDIRLRWLWTGAAGILLFAILRNTETFSFLAP